MTNHAPVLVFDGHNDVLLKLDNDRGSFFKRGTHGHLDLPRAQEGHMGGGFFAIFVEPGHASSPAAVGEPLDVERQAELAVQAFSSADTMPPSPGLAGAQRSAMSQMARLFQLESEGQGRFTLVRNIEELRGALDAGIFAAIMHIEGAEAIDPDLHALEVFYRAGLRSLGIVWSRPNRFGHGVPFAFPSSPDTGPGLTDLGRDLVLACNRLGIMLDLSHITERGFWDVAALSRAPLVATHSNAHALSPSGRNLTDRQLDAIRDSDGMVGVNFHVGFLREDGRRDKNTPLATVARHVEYLVNKLGIERVGFGSDFDGATMPLELGDVTGLPRLIEALRAHGFDEAALRKLGHENWLRVLALTWRPRHIIES